MATLHSNWPGVWRRERMQNLKFPLKLSFFMHTVNKWLHNMIIRNSAPFTWCITSHFNPFALRRGPTTCCMTTYITFTVQYAATCNHLCYHQWGWSVITFTTHVGAWLLQNSMNGKVRPVHRLPTMLSFKREWDRNDVFHLLFWVNVKLLLFVFSTAIVSVSTHSSTLAFSSLLESSNLFHQFTSWKNSHTTKPSYSSSLWIYMINRHCTSCLYQKDISDLSFHWDLFSCVKSPDQNRRNKKEKTYISDRFFIVNI